MTTLIKNGLVYDGSGKEPERKDILIRGNKIVSFGLFPKKGAHHVIDASGSIVMPGFIDVNSDADHYSYGFQDDASELLLRGITTAIGGNFGVSLAPYYHETHPKLFHGSIDWLTFDEFLKTLTKHGVPFHYGSLIGYQTVRGWCTKGNIRDLSLPEEDLVAHTIRVALASGAFGVSFDAGYLFDAHIPFRELELVARLLEKTGKIFSINMEIKDDSSLVFLEEVFNLAKQFELNLQINNFEPLITHPLLFESARQLFEQQSADIQAHFGMKFFNEKLLHIKKFFPSYLQDKDAHVLHKEIHKRFIKEDVLAYFHAFPLQDAVIAKLPSPFSSFEGKTLRAFSESYGISFEEGLLKLAELCGFEGYILCPLVDRGILETFAVSPHSIITGLPFFAIQEGDNSCSLRAFLEFQEKAGLLPLEKAIMKCTSIPAQKYNLRERGFLKENYIADIVILRDFFPSHVLIDGEIVVEEGNIKRKKSGSVVLYT